MANFDSELFGLVFPGFQATQKIHAQNSRPPNLTHELSLTKVLTKVHTGVYTKMSTEMPTKVEVSSVYNAPEGPTKTPTRALICLRGRPTNRSRFLGRGSDEGLFSEKGGGIQ